VIAPIIVDGPKRPVVRGTATRIHVTVASVAAIGERLEVSPIGDLELTAQDRTAHGFDLTVTVRPGSPEAGLAIVAGAVELGRIALATVDAPPPPTAVAAPDPDWFALELGGHAGMLIPPDLGAASTWIGRPDRPGDAISNAPLVGGRIGFFPIARVGVEVEAGIATPSYAGQPGVAALVLTRGQLAVRAVEDGRYGLRLVAGADLLALLTAQGSSHRDAAGAMHFGAAFTVETRRNLWLRIQALDLVTTARNAGYAHCFELQVGVVTRVGRRDHGW
jgi:hypothetical protein